MLQDGHLRGGGPPQNFPPLLTKKGRNGWGEQAKCLACLQRENARTNTLGVSAGRMAVRWSSPARAIHEAPSANPISNRKKGQPASHPQRRPKMMRESRATKLFGKRDGKARFFAQKKEKRSESVRPARPIHALRGKRENPAHPVLRPDSQRKSARSVRQGTIERGRSSLSLPSPNSTKRNIRENRRHCPFPIWRKGKKKRRRWPLADAEGGKSRCWGKKRNV